MNEDLRTEKEKMIESLCDIVREHDEFEAFYETTRRHLDNGEAFNIDCTLYDKDCEKITSGYLVIKNNHELRKKIASFLQEYALEFQQEFDKAIENSSKMIARIRR